MTPERYRNVVEAFDIACGLGPEPRREFLSHICDADYDLRVKVEAMLAAYEHIGGFLEAPPDDIAADMVEKQRQSFIGRNFGEYEVIAHLGTGGMGEVYLARDTRLGRRAALKFLSSEYSKDPVRLRRFEQEACSVSALNHPNVVTVYGFGQVGSVTYIVTEFAEGKTLRGELSNAPLPPGMVFELAVQTLSALCAAHAAGIVHRDIKPENIIVRTDGLVKILDFGLAKRVAESGAWMTWQQPSTISGLLVGTPRYMSPEQARGLSVDARTDLFSLGCVMYEMLSGSPAVPGDNPSDIIAALLAREPAPLRTLRPQCPAALLRVVNRALEKDREKRYQSAQEMLLDLKSAWPTRLTGTVDRVRRKYSYPRVSRRLAIGSIVLMSLGIGAASWVWFAKREAIGQVGGISPVTAYAGDESHPSLSPDGHQVAFSWGGEKGDNRDIYITIVGEQHPLRLTTDPAEDAYPAWSPDGKHIAFIRRHEGTRAEIILISALGGPERTLRNIRLGAWITGRMLAWSPDGKWLCFTTEVGTSSHHVLFLMSPESGTVRQFLREEDNGVGDSSPAFSPNGRWLAFCRFVHPFSSKLFLQHLSPDLKPQARPIQVSGTGANPKAPVWTPDGKKLLFLDGKAIMQAKISGMARPFYISPSAFGELTLAGSPAKPRVLASLQNENEAIWSIPLQAHGLAASGNARRIVPSTQGEDQPQFSPDGRQLSFQSKRTGAAEVWLADADGSHVRQLTHLSAFIVGRPRWSPDGQFLAFHARFPSEAQLYIVSVADGVVRKVTDTRPGLEVPSWSRNGQKLYGSVATNGETNIYTVSARGGIPKLLWKGGDAIEAPGRNLLLYSKEDEPGIYARSLAGDPAKNPERLIIDDYLPPYGGFCAFEDGIYYVGFTPAGRPRAFRFYTFETGKTVDLAPAPEKLSLGLTVSPDRTQLAFGTRSQGGEDLIQIDIR